ncbi:MAG: SGNH/GDSL hydrolase family protein [Ruminococcus sp.]|nr:SGNH/GDSL hydrolase family protein [Ruminococcus sp.]
MLKRITAVILASLTALGLCSCSLTYHDMVEEKREVPVPPKLVFLGDSIAAGYGLEGYRRDDNTKCDSYANMLGEDYTELLKDECGHTMINRAVSGDTSQDLLDHLNSGELDEALAGSDAVVISIGGNDVLHIIFSAADKLGWDDETGDFDFSRVDIKEAITALTSMGSEIDEALDGYDTNIQTIADEVAKRTDGEIYVQTLYNPVEYFEDWKMLVDYADGKIDRFNEIVKSHADDADGTHHYTVVDVGDQFDGRNSQLTNMSDYDIHPNADGHKVIAETVDRELRKHTYSYTVMVEGDEHLTTEGIILIAGSLTAVLLLIVCLIAVLVKKKKA